MKSNNVRRLTDSELDPYIIQYDTHGFTVFKNIVAEATKANREMLIGHYSKLESCLEAIASDNTKSQSSTTVKQFVETYKSELQKIQRIIL